MALFGLRFVSIVLSLSLALSVRMDEDESVCVGSLPKVPAWWRAKETQAQESFIQQWEKEGFARKDVVNTLAAHGNSEELTSNHLRYYKENKDGLPSLATVRVEHPDFSESFRQGECNKVDTNESKHTCAAWMGEMAGLVEEVRDSVRSHGISAENVGPLKTSGVTENEAKTFCHMAHNTHWFFCHQSCPGDHPNDPATFTATHDLVHKIELVCGEIHKGKQVAADILTAGAWHFLEGLAGTLRNDVGRFTRAFDGPHLRTLMEAVQDKKFYPTETATRLREEVNEKVDALYVKQEEADKTESAKIDEQINALYAESSSWDEWPTAAHLIATEDKGFSYLRKCF